MSQRVLSWFCKISIKQDRLGHKAIKRNDRDERYTKDVDRLNIENIWRESEYGNFGN